MVRYTRAHASGTLRPQRSFSDSGLLDQLQQWIDEARAQLDSTGAPP
jgi:hypothetical protein